MYSSVAYLVLNSQNFDLIDVQLKSAANLIENVSFPRMQLVIDSLKYLHSLCGKYESLKGYASNDQFIRSVILFKNMFNKFSLINERKLSNYDELLKKLQLIRAFSQ